MSSNLNGIHGGKVEFPKRHMDIQLPLKRVDPLGPMRVSPKTGRYQYEALNATVVRRFPLRVTDNAGLGVTPGPNDILLGRGSPCQTYPGNQKMRILVEQHKDMYQSQHRGNRCKVANDILQILRARGCRFLVRRGDGPKKAEAGGWEIATEAEAYKKVCHALRSKNPYRLLPSGEYAETPSRASSPSLPQEKSDSKPVSKAQETETPQTAAAPTPAPSSPAADEAPAVPASGRDLAVQMALYQYLQGRAQEER